MVDLANLQSQTTNQPAAMKLDDVEKIYYSPTELDQASAAVAKIKAIPNVDVRTNWDTNTNLPDGYGVVILPMSKRDETQKKRVTFGVAICGVPSLDKLAAEGAKGIEYIQDAVVDAFAIKINNAIRPKADGTVSPSIPFTVEDFLSSQRGKEGFKVYSEVADDFVNWLRGKGLKSINKVTLRQVLQSKQTAETLYPKIPQTEWTKLLDAMVVAVQKKGKDPATLLNWKTTREQVHVVEDEDISEFGDLGSLVQPAAAE